jgi:hypothetical protein
VYGDVVSGPQYFDHAIGQEGIAAGKHRKDQASAYKLQTLVDTLIGAQASRADHHIGDRREGQQRQDSIQSEAIDQDLWLLDCLHNPFTQEDTGWLGSPPTAPLSQLLQAVRVQAIKVTFRHRRCSQEFGSI